MRVEHYNFGCLNSVAFLHSTAKAGFGFFVVARVFLFFSFFPSFFISVSLFSFLFFFSVFRFSVPSFLS